MDQTKARGLELLRNSLNNAMEMHGRLYPNCKLLSVEDFLRTHIQHSIDAVTELIAREQRPTVYVGDERRDNNV